MANEYIPGVCNIGQAEIKMRKLFGWIGLGLCLILGGGFIAYRVTPIWRITLFLPAFIAAIGYLQAKWHFCAKFGLGGVFNFGPDVGKTDTIEQVEYRRQDRQTALKIIGLSTLFGVIVAAAAFFISF
jgi:hypothetical protein